MGKVKHLLKTQTISAKSDRYSNLYSVERAEDGFHIHWRNLRMEFNKPEFEIFINIISGAKQKWEAENKPDKTDEGIVCYDTGNIPPEHGINPHNLRVEWDELMGDAIHIHYKSNRIELSISEFLLFAETIQGAYLELKSLGVFS